MFDNLPVEILSAICEHITHSHPPSVLSLALANKRYYSIASAFLYQTIAIEACDAEQLVLNTQRCEDFLRRDSAFSHVRRFIVRGQLAKTPDSDPALGREWMPFQRLFGSPYVDDDDDDEGIIVSFVEGLVFHHTPDTDLGQGDACWQSLCRLVTLLPGLTDFVFAVANMLPPCLLETIHNEFPVSPLKRLRLHVFDFALPKLAHGESDPHELSLASSPLLHRIWASYCDTDGYDRDGRPSYDGEVFWELVEGFSPNLKDVRLFQDWGDEKDQLGQPLPPPPDWKRFSKEALTPGSLRCLKVDGRQLFHDFGVIPKEVLRRWETSTDFSVLQTLHIRQRLDSKGLRFLWKSCSLPNLSSLALYYDMPRDQPESEALHGFLCALPSLRSLELLGNCAQTLRATAFHPGLRRLCLPTDPGASYHDHLQSIVQRCTQIEDLTLALPRTRGGTDEVNLYRTVGQLPRLRRLDLSLDASSPTHEIRYAVPQHGKSLGIRVPLYLTSLFPANALQFLPDRPVFNTFVDSALDQKLAVAIFHAVSQGKQTIHTTTTTTTNNTSGVLPLEHLSVRVVGAGDWVVEDRAFEGQLMRRQLDPYLRILARPWRVSRDPRDDCRDVLHAEEVGPPLSPAALAECREEGAQGAFLSVFRHIWPERRAGSRWFEDWESWPLEGVDE
jgi:hypothetical protein